MQMIIIAILAMLYGFLGCKPLNNNDGHQHHQGGNNDALLRLEDNLGTFLVTYKYYKKVLIIHQQVPLQVPCVNFTQVTIYTY